MSGFARTLGKVSGIAAAVLSVIPGAQPIAAAFAINALIMNTAAGLLAKRPPVRGGISDITIGADQPTPYMIGDTYCGGALEHKTGYGSPINKVENPYLAMAVVYSAGGPIAGIDQYLADFQPLSFSGDEATGYFSQILFRKTYLGGLLQATALTGPWTAIPGWGADAKLSGKAHVLWSLKWDSKNGKYTSGAPQVGIRGRGVLTWDPRADSSWPGGSGAHRWADPKNRAAFDAARVTWTYSNRPGLHALRYAVGTWERDLNNATSNYVLTFGIGMPVDGVAVEDFVALENICDANDWTVSGVVYEPGDKMANLKRILAAGGAEVCWKGGRLGCKVTSPRVSLDTITRDDLAEGEIRPVGMQSWAARINTAIPEYRSPAHKWEMQQATKISVAAFVTEDGEEKPQTETFEFVSDADQAAELAKYRLYDAREQGPMVLPVKPRLRGYSAGDRLTLEPALVEDFGLLTGEVLVIERSFDPGTMTGSLTLMTETISKHVAVLGQIAGQPPGITIPSTEDYDGAANAPGAVTIEAQPAAVLIAGTSAGAAASGALPSIINNVAYSNGAAVTVDNITIVGSAGCTASISGAVVSINTISGTEGSVTYDVTANGSTVRKQVPFALIIPGTAGASGNSITLTSNVNSAVYAAQPATITINASAAGKLTVNLTGSYKSAIDTEIALQTKIQIRAAGGSFSDVSGSQANGTTTQTLTDPPVSVGGSVNGAGPYTVTGLTAGAAYEIQVLARKLSGDATTTSTVNMRLVAEQTS